MRLNEAFVFDSNNQIQELDESVGSRIARMMSGRLGAGIGVAAVIANKAAITSFVASNLTVLSILKTFGLVNPITILNVATVAAIGIPALVLMFGGYAVGTAIYDNVKMRQFHSQVDKLVDVTNRRDKLILSINSKKDAKVIASDIDRLTEQQKILARQINKSANVLVENDKIDSNTYDAVFEVLELAMEGKLTYLTKKEHNKILLKESEIMKLNEAFTMGQIDESKQDFMIT